MNETTNNNIKMKKVLIISTSLRRESNSHAMAESFARGARETGCDVELLTLRGKDIRFCIGCLSCQQSGKCVIADDMPEIMKKMHDADAICFATPIYYYEMSGQMKTLLDRSNPLYESDYAFTDVYLLATAADDEITAMDGAVKGMGGWIECFERSHLAGVLRAVGVNEGGEIFDHPDYLTEAYEMGRKA